MVIRIIVLTVLLALLAACAPLRTDPEGDIVGDNDIPEIDALFERWDRPGSPGCAVGISQEGEVIYTRGYGYANLDYDVPITPQTVFDVASITKQVIGSSLSLLEERGVLSFQDDVRKWLPELPEYEKPITLYHMTYHISGLRDYLNLFPLAGRDDHFPISHPQILDMMSRQKALHFEPGSDYKYSNTAYMLLAQVVERASGQTITEFVQANFFDPIGMTGSLMYDNYELIIPQRAIGYVRDDDGRMRMLHNFNFDVVGDGQMYTTVDDMLKWDEYLHVQRPTYYKVLMERGEQDDGTPINRAKGLFVKDLPSGEEVVWHTGSSWGFSSVIQRFRDAGLAIAIACNDDDAWPQLIAYRIVDRLLAEDLQPVIDELLRSDSAAQDEEPAVEYLALSAEQMQHYTGEYFSYELDATYRILDDDGLLVRIEQEYPTPLKAVSEDRLEFWFSPDGWDGSYAVQLDMQRDETGDISGFLLSFEDEVDIEFKKRQ